MNRQTAILVVAAGLLALGPGASAEAQVRRPWYRGRAAVAVPWGAGYGATSAVGDARRGMADVIRSQGQAAVDTTSAMINYEEARSRYIDNKLKWTKTYLERKKLGESYRRDMYDKKYAAVRRHLETKESGAPPRPGPDQLDPSTGQIEWPVALRDDLFLSQRREIEELFVLRAQTSGTGEYSRQIHAKVDELKESLQGRIRDFPSYQYIAARNFLDSLSYEGRFPTSG